MQSHEIISWIRKALNAESFIDFKVEIGGKNSATEGYTSDMIFAKVTLAEDDKKIQEIYLAVKFCKRAVREIPLIKGAYKKESYFYNTLINIFKELQNQEKVEDQFDAVPKYYTTVINDQVTFIVFEDLSKMGYQLYRRDLTMNIQHIKLVFKNYARFHAMSFALKHKNGELFSKVAAHFSNSINMLSAMSEFFRSSTKKIVENLREGNRTDLAEKFENLVSKGVEQLLLDLFLAKVDRSAIVHADCHCNNFLFQYKGQDHDNPSKVAILDWQISKLHSPVVDLSYFFYCEASKTELAECTTLLHYYHEELSAFLTKLGCAVDDLFPLSTLLDHWKKYSLYGFLYSAVYMDFNFLDNESAPKLDDVDPAEDERGIANALAEVKLKNPEMYRTRLIGIVEHYFDYKCSL